MKNANEFVCRNCDGTGEMIIEVGSRGYAPIKDSCFLCEGKGIEIFEKELAYHE